MVSFAQNKDAHSRLCHSVVSGRIESALRCNRSRGKRRTQMVPRRESHSLVVDVAEAQLNYMTNPHPKTTELRWRVSIGASKSGGVSMHETCWHHQGHLGSTKSFTR